ncbi:MAG: hypothetical protein R2712_24310 [Vicinamibacterales bacterium]
MSGDIDGASVLVTNRARLLELNPGAAAALPPMAGGLECVVMVDSRYAATCQFRDEPRSDSRPFVGHLNARHRVDRVLLVSGDRASEAQYWRSWSASPRCTRGRAPSRNSR